MGNFYGTSPGGVTLGGVGGAGGAEIFILCVYTSLFCLTSLLGCRISPAVGQH